MRNVLTVLLGLGLVTAWPAGLHADGFLPYDNQGAIADGNRIYAEHCAACHGAALQGEPNWQVQKDGGRMPAPPHDATGHTWHHSDRHLFMITKYGTEALVGGTYESDMMGFEEVLSDQEILQVLAFIKSTWPDRLIDIHNQINADGG